MSIADKLTAIAENEQKVYNAGYEAGKAEGGNSYYDVFWDNFQQNGQLTFYRYAFYGSRWTLNIFNPKYVIKPTSANYMFYESGIETLAGFNKLDMSDCSEMDFFARFSVIKEFPPLNIQNIKSLNSAFRDTRNGCIKVTLNNVREDCTFNATFTNATQLVELQMTGTIGQDGFNVQWSKKLSKASHINIISILSDTTTGLTVTFSLEAVNKAFETSQGAADGSTSDEWTALVASKSNWTISLV